MSEGAFSNMAFFLQLLLDGVSLGFLYGISAIGFVLIYRSSCLLNFAHGGMIAFSAVVFLALSTWAGWPIILSFAITLAGSFVLGLILERCFVRPLLARDNLIQTLLMTLGLALMLKGLLSFLFGAETYHYPVFLPEALSLTWGNLHLTPIHISVFIVGFLFWILCLLFFAFSSQGLAMRSVAENRIAAQSLGVRVKRVFALSWAIAALLCAVSGIMLSMMNGVHIHTLSTLGLKVFPVVILGGLNSIGGAILGGIIIGLLETFSGGLSQSLQDIIPYIALVLILMLKPSGLFGQAKIERV